MKGLEVQVRVKKLSEDSVMPSYSRLGDGCVDLHAVSKKANWNRYIEYGTGLAFEIPEGYVGLLFMRSSVSNTDMRLLNAVGVIDSGYRGEVTFRFEEREMGLPNYEVGDRIGQMLILPYPKIEYVESEELSDSERGAGGYGSTGK